MMGEQTVWHHVERQEFGVLNSISAMIRTQEWRNPGLLTSVRLGPTLVIASDYGGEHSRSTCLTLSFLVADLKYLWLWEELRTRIRTRVLKDARTMSFSRLTEARRAQALVPFLRAANTIPGLLATFVIDKRVRTLFDWNKSDIVEERNVIDRTRWNKRSFEKLVRVAYFGGLLLAGMSRPGQSVLWITDQDDIVANDTKHIEATRVLGCVTGQYIPHPMGHFRLGSTRGDTGMQGTEDLAAIPDLAAGSLADLISAATAEGIFPTRVMSPQPPNVSQKARAVVAWMAERHHPLKKIAVFLEHVSCNAARPHLIELAVQGPLPEYDWVPEFPLLRRVWE